MNLTGLDHFRGLPNIRLIPDSSERHSLEFPSKALGDRFRNRGLPDARWPREAQDRSGGVVSEFANSKEFQDPLLDFVHSIVCDVEDLSGFGDIDMVWGCFAPREGCDKIQIIQEDVVLGLLNSHS